MSIEVNKFTIAAATLVAKGSAFKEWALNSLKLSQELNLKIKSLKPTLK